MSVEEKEEVTVTTEGEESFSAPIEHGVIAHICEIDHATADVQLG